MTIVNLLSTDIVLHLHGLFFYCENGLTSLQMFQAACIFFFQAFISFHHISMSHFFINPNQHLLSSMDVITKPKQLVTI